MRAFGNVSVPSQSDGQQTLRLKLTHPGVQVHGHLERQGKCVDGITISGAWDGQLWASYAAGSRKLLWKANPPYQPDAL